MGVVAGHLDGAARVQVGGAHVDVDAGRDAQPAAPLDAGLCREVLVVGARDARLREHRVAEQPATARVHAAERHTAVDHPREAQVVAGPPRDQRDVALARLVERDRVRAGCTHPGQCLLDHRRVRRPAVAAGQAGQAQVHLHQGVRRACPRRYARGSTAPRRQAGDQCAAHDRRDEHGRDGARAAGDGADHAVHDPATVHPSRRADDSGLRPRVPDRAARP
jgi:hypothetical protein